MPAPSSSASFRRPWRPALSASRRRSPSTPDAAPVASLPGTQLVRPRLSQRASRLLGLQGPPPAPTSRRMLLAGCLHARAVCQAAAAASASARPLPPRGVRACCCTVAVSGCSWGDAGAHTPMVACIGVAMGLPAACAPGPTPLPPCQGNCQRTEQRAGERGSLAGGGTRGVHGVDRLVS